MKFIARLKRLPDWLWLVILSGLMRLPTLASESIWYDEAFTMKVVDPKSDFWKAIIGDTHPPLWNLIQWVNVRIFGTSEFAFRLPAALLSIAGILLIWKIAKLLNFPRRTAFVAGVLVAVLPANLYFAQDGRMYSLLTFTVLLCAYGTILFQVKHKKIGLVLAALGGLAAVYTHNTGVLYVLAIGLISFLNRGSFFPKVITFAGIAILWLPWMKVVANQADTVSQAFWLLDHMSVGHIIQTWGNASIGWRLPDPTGLHIYAATVATTFVSLIVSRKWIGSPQGRIMLGVIFGAPALLTLISIFWENIYVYRVLIPATTASMLLWAYALQHLSPFNRNVARAVIIPCIAIALYGHYAPVRGREDVRAWTNTIREAWQPGDVIYHTSPTSYVTYSYYLSDLPMFSRPGPGDVISVTDLCKEAFGIPEVDIAQLSTQYKRVWVIYEHSPMNRAAEVRAFNSLMHDYSPVLIKTSKPSDLERHYLFLADVGALWL